MARILVVDGGRSGCRAGVVDGGRLARLGSGPGFPPIAHQDARATIAQAVDQALAGWTGARSADAAVVGSTGVFGRSAWSATIARAVASVVRVPAVTVTSDVVTAYAGALGDRPGILVAAGTGAVTLAVGPTGAIARVDGWGYLSGDAGSAYAIGRAVLDEALRALDGRGGSATIADRVLGPSPARQEAADQLVTRLHAAALPARDVAAFAPVASELAADGEPAAVRIVEDAARELARSAAAAAIRTGQADGPADVSWSGGVFTAGETLLAPFRRFLQERLPAAQLLPPDGDALLGAARIGATGTGPADPASRLEPLLDHIALEVVA